MIRDRGVGAAYATNVHHYPYVLEAMAKRFGSVQLFRRWEIGQRQYNGLSRLPLPPSALRELGRRVSPTIDPSIRVLGLGKSNTVRTLASKAVSRYSPDIAATTHSSAKYVSRNLSAPFFQFVEGLGHEALLHREISLSFMERRNLHHEVFEREIQTEGGFPHRRRDDPLRDMLETEYSLANYIVVYSEVARASFIERGFAPEKLIVVPLAASAIPTKSFAGSDRPERSTFLYVGRGDAFKGIDVAVAAVAGLGRSVRLRVAGPMSSDAQAWLAKQRHVDYLGVLTRAQLAQEYARCVALLAPSVESFGLAIIDAVAHGARVLCLDSSGVGPELGSASVYVVPDRSLRSWEHALAIEMDRPRSVPQSDDILAEWSWEASSARLYSAYVEKMGYR